MYDSWSTDFVFVVAIVTEIFENDILFQFKSEFYLSLFSFYSN